MLHWKLVICILALQNAFGQDVPQHLEEELNGNSKYLKMSANGLKETLDLRGFTNLENADFSNNEITELQWKRIATATNLKTLDLSGNPDLLLPDVGPPTDLPLSVLNMSYCNVDVIAKDALNGLTNLETLDLRGNPLLYETSPIFENLESPPKRLIVSTITTNELEYVCKYVDMLVEVVDDEMTFECKDVRRDQRGAVANKSPNRELMKKDYIVDGVMPADTHMEMLSDQPIEGSGDDEVEASDAGQKETDLQNEDNEKQQAEEELTDKSIPEETSSNDDKTDVDQGNSSQTTDGETETSKEPQSEKESSESVPFRSINFNDEEVPPLRHEPHKQENDENHNTNVSERSPEPRKILTRIDINAQEESKNSVQIGEAKPQPQADTGKKVILVLVIGAAIMGSVFGIMKVYKDRKRKAAHNGAAACEGGQEMKEISECKPLMTSAPAAANGQSKVVPGEACTMVVVENVVARNGDAMTAKEILADADVAGIPDIDDANRLSTVLVSNQNLDQAK